MKPTPDHYCELAPFAEEFQRGTPALLYHRIGQARLLQKRRGLTLPLGVFRHQLRELRAAGYSGTGVPPAVTQEQSSRDGCWSRRRDACATITLTFDDGDATTLAALEPLRECAMQAVQFLVADRIGGVNDWDATGEPLMDAAQVQEWLGAGHHIGSHTLTHARLSTLAPAARREEIVSSRAKLKDRFGVAVVLFAYPWGEWDARLADEVAAAGYRVAFTTERGVNDATTSPFSMKRHTVWCALRRPRELWLALTK